MPPPGHRIHSHASHPFRGASHETTHHRRRRRPRKPARFITGGPVGGAQPRTDVVIGGEGMTVTGTGRQGTVEIIRDDEWVLHPDSLKKAIPGPRKCPAWVRRRDQR